MNQANRIRLLIVDSSPSSETDQEGFLELSQDIEIVGIAHSKRAAIQQAESTRPDVILVDLMLPALRSIEVISYVSGTLSDTKILALSPGDPPYDRVILSAQAGALGFITRDSEVDEILAAIQAVFHGEHWLPKEETFQVLEEAAPELAVSAKERRNRLTELLLGIIPLTGLLAAITAFLWREYWGQIGVRVVDLGVDPSSRMTEVLVSILLFMGLFGPMLFIDAWMRIIDSWTDERSGLAKAVANAQKIKLLKLPIGRIIFSRWVAWIALALVVLTVTFTLNQFAQLILILFVGPGVAVILLANILGMDDQLPKYLALPREHTGRALGIIGGFFLIFLLVLGAEIFIEGPDLRTDGMHGILAPKVLDLSARPVLIHDLDEKQPPLGALYLGGNADLYVLYDPCVETVRFVPVGSSRVEHVPRVTCKTP